MTNHLLIKIPHLSPFLKIRTTMDFFQTAGKMPVDKDRLNRSVSKSLTTETNFLSMDGKMLSGPSPFGSFQPENGLLNCCLRELDKRYLV
jgi:hypothetical protein